HAVRGGDEQGKRGRGGSQAGRSAQFAHSDARYWTGGRLLNRLRELSSRVTRWPGPVPPVQRLSWPAAAAAIVYLAMAYTIRPARTPDVPMIRKLIDSNVESGRLLSKATVTLYEDIQEFCVAELDGDSSLAGCGALHVMWEDLAEIRTVAVAPACQGLGIGHGIVGELLARARVLGV